MSSHRPNAGYPEFNQSEMQMVLYYFGCRFEVAGSLLRELPVEAWPTKWEEHMKVDVVSNPFP